MHALQFAIKTMDKDDASFLEWRSEWRRMLTARACELADENEETGTFESFEAVLEVFACLGQQFLAKHAGPRVALGNKLLEYAHVIAVKGGRRSLHCLRVLCAATVREDVQHDENDEADFGELQDLHDELNARLAS